MKKIQQQPINRKRKSKSRFVIIVGVLIVLVVWALSFNETLSSISPDGNLTVQVKNPGELKVLCHSFLPLHPTPGNSYDDLMASIFLINSRTGQSICISQEDAGAFLADRLTSGAILWSTDSKRFLYVGEISGPKDVHIFAFEVNASQLQAKAIDLGPWAKTLLKEKLSSPNSQEKRSAQEIKQLLDDTGRPLEGKSYSQL